MPRSRKATPTTTSNTNTQGEVKKMALDATKIAALRGKNKTRGAGGHEIREFLASGEAGVEVSLTTGRFAGKDGKSVQTSLNNAKKSANANGLVFPDGPDLQVIVEKAEDSDDGNEHVYLINPNVEVAE